MMRGLTAASVLLFILLAEHGAAFAPLVGSSMVRRFTDGGVVLDDGTFLLLFLIKECPWQSRSP
jgi:hypothetical protein